VTFELESLPDGRTRLVARGDPQGPAGRAFYEPLVRIPQFVMERKMLLGIKLPCARRVAGRRTRSAQSRMNDASLKRAARSGKSLPQRRVRVVGGSPRELSHWTKTSTVWASDACTWYRCPDSGMKCCETSQPQWVL
jgi:hypothetical protein